MFSIKCLTVYIAVLLIVPNYALDFDFPSAGKRGFPSVLESAKNKIAPLVNKFLQNSAQGENARLLDQVPSIELPGKEYSISSVSKLHPGNGDRLLVLPEFGSVLIDKRLCPRLQGLGERLLHDQVYCDIVIEVTDPFTKGSGRFCAHRSILALRSHYLLERISILIKKGNGGHSERLRHPSEKLHLVIVGANPDVFKYILQYIYTDKIDRDFNVKKNILDLLVFAQLLGLNDLVDMIKEYLSVTLTPSDIGPYLDWANKRGDKLILRFILTISRKIMNMKDYMWRLFMKNICEAYRYEQGVISDGPDIPFNTVGVKSEIEPKVDQDKFDKESEINTPVLAVEKEEPALEETTTKQY